MYLKRLEITGFKSFADTTKLHFDSGIIAIVGPNGCGKSNIADAVRWVLGEQSAKAIRGKSMEDVVFSGTDRRRAMGMAEVNLTLGDAEELGIEYSEITVTRRVYRSGESQYLINKTPCRLKDIQDLFADTGMGRTAYSIMAQGKIDQILSSRPEERRLVFEEAAGITRYKARRNEALRKLSATENNLLRLGDILKEVERRRNSLQRQASKALKHQELSDQKRGLEWAWVLNRSRELSKLEEEVALKVAAQEARLELDRQALQEKERQLDEFRHNQEELEGRLGDLRQQRGQLEAQQSENENLLRVNQERIDEIEELTERHTHDITSSNQRKSELEQQLDDLREQRAMLEIQVDENREGLEEQQLGLQLLRDKFNNLQESLVKLRDSLFTRERGLSDAHNQIAEAEARLRGFEERQERLELERENQEQAFNEAQEFWDDAVNAYDEAHADYLLSEEQVRSAQNAVDEVRDEQEANRETLSNLREAIGQLQSRLSVFEQLEAAFEGYQKGAQAILKRELDGAPTGEEVLGTLASRLDVANGYDLAIEAALGEALQTIVIDHPETAASLFRSLDEQKKGRAILYPIREPLAHALAPEAETELTDMAVEFGLKKAREFCSSGEELAPLIIQLLAKTWVARDLGTAIKARKAGFPNPLVTLAGESISGSGLIEGGTRQSDTESLLARQSLIHHLRVELATKQEEMEIATARREDILIKLELAEQESVSSQEQMSLATRRLATAESEKESRLQELQRIKKHRETLAWESERLTEEAEERRNRLAVLRDQGKVLDAQVAKLRHEIKGKEEQIQVQREEQESVMENLSEHKVKAARLQQEFEVCCRQIPITAQRIEELEQSTRKRSQDLDTFKQRKESLGQQMEDARELLGLLRIQSEELDEKIDDTQTHRSACQEIIRETETELRSARKGMEATQQTVRELEVGLARTRTQREDLHQRFEEEYGLSIEQIPNEQLPELGINPQWEDIQRQIADLKARLERMGPVNLLAIEEHKELCDRFEFLQDQNSDLVNSRDQLVSVIHRINRTSQELFEQTFSEVRNNFQELFAKLFGGGKADLLLSESEDPLEAGIEIIAQPPSKKLQNINLLSGGERTLTAVALLFALYQVKPSPFCLLDELDAPLDESNIDRFARLVQEFSKQSQFLLITHNRRTIGIADTIYGVTMEETGVSNMVSVRMRTDPQGRAVLDDRPDLLLEDHESDGSDLPGVQEILRNRATAPGSDESSHSPLDELVEEMQEAEERAKAVQEALKSMQEDEVKAEEEEGQDREKAEEADESMSAAVEVE
jgi:chromosome segregation protein